ncbi:MAG: FG-GAP-like repeat-containing protein [Balneolaceae bacterium]
MKRFKVKYVLFLAILATSLWGTQTVFAQEITGVDTVKIVSESWQFYDFTSGKAFTIADTATYTADFMGSSNEGVNFGKEFNSLIPDRHLLLLGTGNIDTVASVPAWTDEAPWVDTSWDFTNGTQGAPISVGQLWVVYTSEGLYAVMEITALPDGEYGGSFVFKYKYMSEGGTTFPNAHLNEPTNPEIQISGVDIGTGFTFTDVIANSKTSATATYNVTGVNLEGDIQLASEGVNPRFDLSLTGTVFSGEVIIPQADATNKMVTVRAIVSANNGRTYQGKITHSTPNGEVVEIPVSVIERYEAASVTITAPLTGSTEVIGNDVTINWGVSNLVNEQLTLEYSIDQSNWAPLAVKLSGLGTYAFNTTPLSAGTYYLRISAKDLPTPVFSNVVSVILTAGGSGEEQHSGSATSTSGTGFDFSRQEMGDNNDAGDYQPDFVFVSNEGVNFGNEGSTSLEFTGRRFVLLGQGLLDSLTSVPVRVDAAPWVTVSYDFTNGTQGQPISAGQLWGVYTRDGKYAAMEITSVPESYGSEFSFKYKYQPNGSRTFKATNSETERVLNIAIRSGNNQTATVNSSPSEALMVFVTENADAVENEEVIFRIVEVPDGAGSSGTVTNSDITNSVGVARAFVTAGDVQGEYHIKAMIASDTTKFVTFILNAEEEQTGPQPTTLVITDGQSQSAYLGDTVSTNFELTLLDNNGNSMNGLVVTFEEISKPEGAASGRFFTPDGITVNQAGIFNNRAKMSYSVGDKAGEYKIKAYLAEYPGVDSVVFVVTGELVKAPLNLIANGGGGISLEWDEAASATMYAIYRAHNDDNPANASLLATVSTTSYQDDAVTAGETYYYWVASKDRFGNESASKTGPISATAATIGEVVTGNATVEKLGGKWQYFDFSKGFASNEADTGSYQADFRGSSNEGVNFGNENATQIEGNRIILLEATSLDAVTSIPVWTNQSPWIGTTWDFANGTKGRPISVGQVWGVYTREGHYAAMEITSIPENYGSEFSFKYKYQPSGSNQFEEVEAVTPTVLNIVSGNGQIGLPNSTLAEALKVRVQGDGEVSAAGVTVTFNVSKKPEGAIEFSLGSATVISNSEGFAETNFTLGDKLGEYEITVSVAELEPVKFTVTAAKAAAPESVTLLEVRDGFRPMSLIPEWSQSKSENFLRYRVYMGLDESTLTLIDTTRSGSGSIQDTSRVVGNLEVLKNYTFAVTVVNQDLQESKRSNAVTNFVKPVPDQPKNVVATPGDGAVQLTWSPNDSTAFHYYYVYSGKDGYFQPKDTLWNVTDTTLVIGNLENEQMYQFYVIAVNRYGKESSFPPKVTAIPVASYVEETSTLPSLINGSTAWGDVDGDGDLDVILTGQVDATSPPVTKLYINYGGNIFDLAPDKFVGVINSSVFWYDVDNNGYIDLIITGTTATGPISKVYLNADGTFTDAGFTLPGLGDGLISPVDFDQDGDLDLLVAGDAGTSLQTVLIENKGDGNFSLLAIPFEGVKDAAAAWGDYNGDGRPDLLLTGLNGSNEIIATIYKNDGEGSFTPQSTRLQGVISGTVAWSDFNVDGQKDILITGFTNTAKTDLFTGLYTNNNGEFSLFYSSTSGGPNKAVASNLRSRATLGDYDNDGDDDVLLSTGSNASILKNNRNGIIPENLNLGIAGSVVWADIDGDGDLDIVATGSGENGAKSVVLSNNTQIRNTAPTVPASLLADVASDTVKLSWNHSTDAQTPFVLLTYNVRVGSSPGASDILAVNADLETGRLKVLASGNTGNRTSLKLNSLKNGTYYWQVQAIDNAYLGSAFAQEQQFKVERGLVSNDNEIDLPSVLELKQNFPNPFNPSTNIQFSIPKTEQVTLNVFDITGRLVAEIINGKVNAGVHSHTFDASHLASGMYIYRLQVGSKAITKKMILIK